MPDDAAAPPAPRGPEQELLDLIPRLPLLPGENAAAFEDLRQALLSELAPSTAYQTAVAENLIVLEWEIHRHRILHNGLLRKGYRKAAAKLWEKDQLGILANVGMASKEATAFADGLLDPQSDHAALSHIWLAERNINPSEISAAAYEKSGSALQPHEQKLADLEKRRRHLREDYDKLKASRANVIEEAQFVERDGD